MVVGDIESVIGLKIVAAHIATGGDINESFILSTSESKFFLKINQGPRGSDILASEAQGLSILAKHHVSVPEIIISQTGNNIPYLLLEYIDADDVHDDYKLAESLNSLHENKSEYFGLDEDNYIGSLVQSNRRSTDMHSFLINSRFLPQIELAKKNGFLIGVDSDKFFKRIENVVPSVEPSLIHGDLWSGNLLSSDGLPVFIDPSVSYCHPEFDLGMMSLFGGFSSSFFNAYEEMNPSAKGFRNRADIFQLYYLLVHLNIFGSSYERRVRNILEKYA